MTVQPTVGETGEIQGGLEYNHFLDLEANGEISWDITSERQR